MAKFHVNPKTGEPGACRAKKHCPFGDLSSDHYDSKDAARTAYELRNAAVPAPMKALNTYNWPEQSETRRYKTERGEVTMQIGDPRRSLNDSRYVQAWLTTPDGGNVAYVNVRFDEHDTVGACLEMCDIETRLDSRGQGFARELRESLEKETGLLIYSGESFTPEGWEAFGSHIRTIPRTYMFEDEKPGVKYGSMGFVASWKNMIPREPERSIQYSEEQREVITAMSRKGEFQRLDEERVLWVED